jgi:hypothetical protein
MYTGSGQMSGLTAWRLFEGGANTSSFDANVEMAPIRVELAFHVIRDGAFPPQTYLPQAMLLASS